MARKSGSFNPAKLPGRSLRKLWDFTVFDILQYFWTFLTKQPPRLPLEWPPIQVLTVGLAWLPCSYRKWFFPDLVLVFSFIKCLVSCCAGGPGLWRRRDPGGDQPALQGAGQDLRHGPGLHQHAEGQRAGRPGLWQVREKGVPGYGM